MAITRVRNNLIEHPDEGALYSFSVGTSGPSVKPMHKGESAWDDQGLVSNIRDFVDAIVSGCSEA